MTPLLPRNLPVDLLRGLRHEWLFDSSPRRNPFRAVDSIGQQHGTSILTSPIGVPTRRGVALDRQIFNLPPSGALDYTGSALTLEAWVHLSGSAPFLMLVNAYLNVPPFTGWGWGTGPVGQRISLWSSSRGSWADSSTMLPLNAPSHVATVVQSDGTGTHYINGIPAGTFAGPALVGAGATSRAILGLATGTNYFVGGVVSLRIWDRALSGGQVRRLFGLPALAAPRPLRGAQAAAFRPWLPTILSRRAAA